MVIRRASAALDRGRRTSPSRSALFRRTFAVFAALLMVTSLVAGPANAGQSTPDAAGPERQTLASLLSTDDQHVQQPRVDPQPAPRAQFAAVRAAIREMEPPTDDTDQHRRQALAAFDRSVHGYRTAVDPGAREPLTDAAEGTRELAESVGTAWDAKSSLEHLAAIRNASHTSVEAARANARWEIAVANRTIRQREHNLTDAQRERLGNELAQAETAYDDGWTYQNGTAEALNTTDRWQFKEGVYDRGRAIGKYSEAWEKARRTVEIAEEEYDVEPDVVDADADGLIDARERVLGTDLASNDSDGDGVGDWNETAGGFPIDTDEDGTIDALDDDSDADEVPDGHPSEGLQDTDENGVVNLRDTDDDGDGIPSAIEVRDGWNVSHDVDRDDTSNWVDTDADGDGDPDAVEGRVDEDGDGVPAYLDNDADDDGLPDFYEENVTGTDPTDDDSDYPATPDDEANDGLLDGMEDPDGDGLATQEEYAKGTDPLAADSDGDGLSDDFEVRHDPLDPLSADSDGDGVPDNATDHDDDGLDAAAEIEAGTDLLDADTDGDGLDDGREVELGTDPLAVDSDDDGLADPEELELPTDPTDPDTDDDGVLDGDESFTTSARNDDLGAEVSLTGVGDVSASTVVEEPDHVRFSEANAPNDVTASEFVHVDVGADFASAAVTLEYDEASVQTNESSLAVYRFDEASGAYERLPSTVDAANDTVTGTTSEFSTVVVMDSEAAVDRIRQRSRELDGVGVANRTAVEYDFETGDAIDIPSGENRTVNGNEWRCENLPRDDNYRDTPISGTCEVRDGKAIVREETNRQRTLEHTLELPTVADGEELFVEASLVAEINDQWSNTGIHINVTTEDGKHRVFWLDNDWSDTTEQVAATPRVDVTEFAGEEATIEFSARGRHTYESEDTMSWIEVDRLAFVRFGESDVDSDGDGITDVWERRGVPLAGSLGTLRTNATDADTDGDGLADGAEVDTDSFREARAPSDADVLVFPGFEWSSDPLDVDTDDDGLEDGTEVEGWQIQVAPNASSARSYVADYREKERLRDEQTPYDDLVQTDPHPSTVDPERHLVERIVTADPRRTDTDGDGFGDFEERTNFTDPGTADTDGDGIDDAQEAGADQRILHDYRAPQVIVHDIHRDWSDQDVLVSLELADLSGVSNATVTLAGHTESVEFPDEEAVEYERVRFELSAATFLALAGRDLFLAQSVDVAAADSHGNLAEMTYYGTGLFADLADAMVDAPLPWDFFNVGEAYLEAGAVGLMGPLSGARRAMMDVARGLKGLGEIGAAAVDAAAELVELALNPEQWAAALVEIAEEVHQFGETLGAFLSRVAEDPLGTLGTLIVEPIAGFHGVQQRMNPFPPGGQNVTFASTWYTGYVLGQVALMVVGAGIASKVGQIARYLPYGEWAVRSVAGAGIAARGMALNTFGKTVAKLTRHFPDIDVRTDAGREKLRQLMRATRGMPSTAFDRMLRRLDLDDAAGERIRNWMFSGTAPELVGQGVAYLRVGSKALLNRMLLTDREELAEWLVEFRHRQAFQRQLATAWDEGELSLSDVGKLQARHEALDAGEQAAYHRLLSDTGSQGLEATSDADPDGLSALVRLDDGPDADPDVMADGGHSPAATLLRADYNNDDIDSGAIASKITDDFADGEAELAKDVMARTGVPGVRFVDEVTPDDMRKLKRGVLDESDYDADDVATLVRNADGHAGDLVNRFQVTQLERTFDLRALEQRRLVEIAYDGEIDGDARFASDDVDPEALLDSTEALEIDVDEVLVAATDPDGNLRILTPDRWEHIEGRHIDGTESNPNAEVTGFYPRGQTVTQGGETVELPTPAEGPVTDAHIRRMTREAVEAGETDADYIVAERGIDTIRVGVGEDGVVSTAFPVRGTTVRRFNHDLDRWERWDGDSWVEWNYGDGSTSNALITPRLGI